jgi:hypothetical protein
MIESTNNGGGPGPKSTLGLALQDADRFGVGIFEGALEKRETDEVRRRLWAVAEAKPISCPPMRTTTTSDC